MPQSNSKTAPLADAYAQSLLELARERQVAEPVGQELDKLRQIIESDPAFQLYLEDPTIGSEDRRAVLDKALSGEVSTLVLNFLHVANEHGRLGLLTQIAGGYDVLLDEWLGKIEVDVTVAQRLDAEKLETVRQRISKALGKDAVVHQYVDPDIIGGLVLRVQDRVIDASVKHQLAEIQRRLLAARPSATPSGEPKQNTERND